MAVARPPPGSGAAWQVRLPWPPPMVLAGVEVLRSGRGTGPQIRHLLGRIYWLRSWGARMCVMGRQPV